MRAEHAKCTDRGTRRQPVWSWTDAVARANVPPLTKLVCLNIARYLSSAGKGWSIPIKDMIDDTGLGNQAIARHLKIAKAAGLLTIRRNFDPRTGHRTVTTYRPRFPRGVVLASQPAKMADPSDDPSPEHSDADQFAHGSSDRLSVRGTSRRLSVRGTRQVPSHKGKANQGKDPYGSCRGVDDAASATSLGKWGTLQ